MLFTEEDCIKSDIPLDYSVGFLVLDVKNCLKPEYQSAKYQLVTGCGFGCNPCKISNSVFVSWFDDDQSKYTRFEILGIAKAETVEAWRKLYGDEIKPDTWLSSKFKTLAENNWHQDDAELLTIAQEAYKKETENE